MRKLLVISIALLASCLTWAQPAAAPGEPEYVSDKDIICSYSGTTSWFGGYPDSSEDKASLESYTYPGTSTSINYMHITLPKANTSYVKETSISVDYSAFGASEYVHIEIWSTQEADLDLKLSKGGPNNKVVHLNAEQWNSFDLNLHDDFGVTTYTAVGSVRFKAVEATEIYVDNYYFHHGVRIQGPERPPRVPQYESDKDILCSYTGAYQWYSKAKAYTYPTTSTTLNYMHFNIMKGNNASPGSSTQTYSAETEYVHLEIYPLEDISLTLSIPTGGTESKVVALTGGEWNSVNIDLNDFGVNLSSAVGFLRFESPNATANFYVDNYYFHHGVEVPRLTVGDPDSEGVAPVTGTITAVSLAELLEEIQDEKYKDVVFYNLKDADISKLSGTFSTRFTAANPNAAFGFPSNDYRLGMISNKTNVGTISVEGKKFYPKGNVEFVDGYDILYPTYNIGTLPVGSTISYTRESISGVATTILPFDADVPEGVTAYEFSSVDGLVLKFSEVKEMTAFKPYIIEGSSLEVSSTATKNNVLLSPVPVDVIEGVKFTGTFQAISATTTTTDDNKYVLTAGGTSALFKKSHGKIGAFRAYLEYTAPSARTFNVVFEDQATGIRQATNKELEVLFNVYSIDGRAVKSQADTLIDLPAGIYVINGKKVVIK